MHNATGVCCVHGVPLGVTAQVGIRASAIEVDGWSLNRSVKLQLRSTLLLRLLLA